MIHKQSSQALSRSGFEKNEVTALKISVAVGALAGIIADVIYAFTVYTGFHRVAGSAIPAIIVVSALVQLVSAAGLAFLFAFLFIKLEVRRLPSFPAGIFGGLLFGVISGGLTFGTILAIAVPSGAIVLVESVSHIDTGIEAFGFGFFGGGVFGALIGLIVGLIGGPLLSFRLRLGRHDYS
jgi:hypothetical protein